MDNTTSGSLETHQEVYEWWRSKKSEISNSIEALRSSGSVEQETLDIMEDLLGGVKIRTSIVEYFDEEMKDV